jgi:excisionase family DNA binding protein
MSHFPLVKASDWCGEFAQATSSLRRLSAPARQRQANEDMRLVVSSREAAEMLSVSERHLHMLSSKGDLPKVRIGARVCYRVETLRAWLAAHEHQKGECVQ